MVPSIFVTSSSGWNGLDPIDASSKSTEGGRVRQWNLFVTMPSDEKAIVNMMWTVEWGG
eukprot:m.186754 g.186754  ORF g.186754 m.186754 type:complete len:59 (-) comp24773_c0_seq2:14-190(-)